MSVEPLPVRHVADVEAPAEMEWLVDGLWPEQGVGFLGGHPKSCKSWLAFDIALSVATRTPVVGHYAVRRGGPVLLFAAEDAPAMVRARLCGMAAQRGVSLDDAPIQLVLADSLRLESPGDQARLRLTVEACRPRLLILDPFVRLSRIDENSALEVSTVLAFLRELQRREGLAILVVHHVRKSAGTGGVALRGSGDFWAWSDTNLYLTRSQQSLKLAIEHRCAATPDPLSLELHDEDSLGPRLRVCRAESEVDREPAPLAERVLAHLRAAGDPCRLDEVRAAMRVRMQTLVDTLRHLEADGLVRRAGGGWQASGEQGARDAVPS